MNKLTVESLSVHDVVERVLGTTPGALVALGRAIAKRSDEPELLGVECMLRLAFNATARVEDKIRSSKAPVFVNAVVGATPEGWQETRLATVAQLLVWALLADNDRAVFSFRREGQPLGTSRADGIDLVALLSARKARRLPRGKAAILEAVGIDMFGAFEELDQIREKLRAREAALGIVAELSTNTLIKEAFGLDPFDLVRPLGVEAVAAYRSDPDGWGRMGLGELIHGTCSWISEDRNPDYRLFNAQDAEDGLWANERAANLAMLLAAAFRDHPSGPASFLPPFDLDGTRAHDLERAASRFWRSPSRQAFQRLERKCAERVHHSGFGSMGATARILLKKCGQTPDMMSSMAPDWLQMLLREHDTAAWQSDASHRAKPSSR